MRMRKKAKPGSKKQKELLALANKFQKDFDKKLSAYITDMNKRNRLTHSG